MEQAQRKTYLDILRILGVVFVVCNHVAGANMRLFDGASGVAILTMMYLSKCAIPLFLMVTGALLLPREESYGKIALRIGRIVLVLVLVTVFYYGTQCAFEHAPFTLSALLDTLYHTMASGSLWYLYLYIGVLVMLPILQRMAASLGESEHRYFLFWSLFFLGGMTLLQSLSPLFLYDNAFVLSIFAPTVGMLVLGFCLDKWNRPTPVKTVFAIAVPLMLAVLSALWTVRDPDKFRVFDNAFLFPAMVTAYCLFYLVKSAVILRAPAPRAQAALRHLSRLVFTIYLLSDFAILRLQFIREAMVPSLGTNGAGLAYCAVVLAACALAAELLTRIPGLRKLL